MLERKTSGISYYAGHWPLDMEKSTLVFIHGAGGSGLFWQAQVSGLAQKANTLAIDLPGHGGSDGGGLDKIEDYARAVVGFMQAVDIHRPVLCGLSMGGGIVQQLLFDRPALLKGGILIGTGARLKVAPVFFETIEKDYQGFVDWLCKICVSKKTNPPVIKPFREDLLRCRPEVVSGDFRACDRFDMADRLSTIDAPVLVVTAEADKLTPPNYGAALSEGIKNSSRVHIMDAGHIVPMEKPIEVNRAIMQFLDRTGL